MVACQLHPDCTPAVCGSAAALHRKHSPRLEVSTASGQGIQGGASVRDQAAMDAQRSTTTNSMAVGRQGPATRWKQTGYWFLLESRWRGRTCGPLTALPLCLRRPAARRKLNSQ